MTTETITAEFTQEEEHLALIEFQFLTEDGRIVDVKAKDRSLGKEFADQLLDLIYS